MKSAQPSPESGQSPFVANPGQFGLKLENADARRAILSISDMELLLSQDVRPIVPEGMKSRAQRFFDRHPQGLKQLFLKLSSETISLGDHSHAAVAEGGMGEECFLFTHIPPRSSVNVEQYELGRSAGKIRYGLKSGAAVINRPGEYHTFTVTGPVGFLQVAEGADFIPEDLRPFDDQNATPEDIRMVRGVKL